MVGFEAAGQAESPGMNLVSVGHAGESGLCQRSERPGFRPLEVVGEVFSGVRAHSQSSGCSCVPPRPPPLSDIGPGRNILEEMQSRERAPAHSSGQQSLVS